MRLAGGSSSAGYMRRVGVLIADETVWVLQQNFSKVDGALQQSRQDWVEEPFSRRCFWEPDQRHLEENKGKGAGSSAKLK